MAWLTKQPAAGLIAPVLDACALKVGRGKGGRGKEVGGKGGRGKGARAGARGQVQGQVFM
jgi:hypothetical protein